MERERIEQDGRLEKLVPRLIFLLFLLQPALDVLSYWQAQLGAGNLLTLTLRFGMLVAVALAGFAMSRRKKLYFALAAVLVGFELCHVAAVLQVDLMTLPVDHEATGLSALVADVANDVRIMQLPVFTLSFATFLSRSKQSFAAVQKGFVAVFLIIAAVEIISVVTGTNPYTYVNKSIGTLGWFYFANSQSAILSMIVPVVVMASICRKGSRLWQQLIVFVLGFGMLFFFGTRSTYLAILATGAGVVFTLLLTDRKKWKSMLLLVLCTAVCVGGFYHSPMYENQRRVGINAVGKQALIDAYVSEDSANAERYSVPEHAMAEARVVGAYHLFLGGMVEKYGISPVAEQYQYTTDVSVVANLRLEKRTYAQMMMERAPLLSKLFGLELGDMVYIGRNYDVENDVFGIYILCGVAGLALLAAFLTYFAVLILLALKKNAKRYFTPAAGAYGVALCMAMLHAFATAGLLRRPNASFYLSVVLAVIYYLVKIRAYVSDEPGTEEKL